MKPKKEINMTKQDLRLWYKQDNGKDIPDLNEFDVAGTDEWMLDEYKEYVKWLEEGLIAAKEIIQNLQSDIITNKSMKE